MKRYSRKEKLQAWWALAMAGATAYGLWKQRKRIPDRHLGRSQTRDLNNNMLRIETAIHPGVDMADLRARGQWEQQAPSLWKGLGEVAAQAGRDWVSRRAASKGAALALYTLFSLAPMLVLVVAMAGIFFGPDTVRGVLVEQMQGLMGARGGEAIQAILAGTQRPDTTILAGIISGLLVLVSATGAFAELKGSLDELWEVPAGSASGVLGFLRQRVLSFGLLAVLALMLIISLVVSTGLDALQNLWSARGEAPPVWHLLVQVLSDLASFGIVTALFAAIFKYLPSTEIAWKDVLVGGAITAALFTIGKAAISMYVANANIDSAYGAAGSVVILIVWIYYSAQIFFYGALFTHEYARRIGSHAGPAPQVITGS
ncbi:YihY/virulence factor BrkB family protein [Lacisediminimonas profundi]|uniref:YihY/virulence factor BrkB family protein n=1 Tax=Lacisediminimonas profundi TaxID=2603856 RepID=UPI00124AEE2C|nr:YihY/virulence factor BrkB family protein [Lacisediminimonas profundi]